MNLEIFLARRYLSSHRGRGLSVITWIALAGVVVGVMSLVGVLAVMSGFDRDLREKILGNNAHILVQFSDAHGPIKEVLDSNLDHIRKTDGVASAMPVIYGEGLIPQKSF
jgi:lipoprotein-releasing system permease protein